MPSSPYTRKTDGNPNITAEHYADAGDDSFPLTTDYAVLAEIPGTGRYVVVGYVDPVNAPKGFEGDKRIYARDPNTGLSVVETWLKSDGTAVTENANGSHTLNPDGSQKGTNSNGSFELKANGDFDINGFIIKANGDAIGTGSIAAPSMVVDGKELDDHTHSGVTTGPSNTGPNN